MRNPDRGCCVGHTAAWRCGSAAVTGGRQHGCGCDDGRSGKIDLAIVAVEDLHRMEPTASATGANITYSVIDCELDGHEDRSEQKLGLDLPLKPPPFLQRRQEMLRTHALLEAITVCKP